MSKSRLAKVTLASDVEPGAELVKWSCKEGYVYVPLPPAGTGGHRADKWDVDKWFKALKVELVAVDDEMFVRLSDQETAELFAECPLPCDGTPLTTAVEPVVDSSRYFVLRVVDRETGKHAFVGLGFRERNDASGFTTGLDEYRRYLKRKAEADAMKAEHERQENGEGGPPRDLSLKQSITLKIGSMKRHESEPAGGGCGADQGAAAAAAAAAPTAGMGSLKLQPPPPPAAKAKAAAEGAAAAAGGVAPAAAAIGMAAGGDEEEADDWGAFTGPQGQ